MMLKQLKGLLQSHFYLFGVIAIFAGALLWLWLIRSETTAMAKQTRYEAELLTANLFYEFTEFKNSMGRMAERLRSVNKSSDSSIWVKDANSYIDEFSGLMAIIYLKYDMEIIGLVSNEEWPKLTGKNLGDYSDIRRTIEDAAYTYSPHFGDHAFPFFSGNLFYGVFPITVADQVEGYLVAVMDYDKWLSKGLPASQFRVRVFSGNHEKFARASSEGSRIAREFATFTDINITGLNWQVEFTPGWKNMMGQKTMLPWAAMGFGFIIAVLFATYGYLQRELDASKLKNFNASRLHEIAEVVSGLSHEVNNPLAIVQGAVYQLQRRIHDPQIDRNKIHDITDKIDRASQRIARVVEGLRLFAREGSHDPFISASVSEVFENVRALCGMKLEEKGIKFEIRDYSRDATFECILGQIVRLLLTLINNSVDAVETSTNKWIHLDAQDLGNSMEFSVTDSGAGIPENIRGKLMNPFFTTKEVGKGTGLGLSMARGIARGHNGQLLLDEHAQNTRFILIIPKLHKIEKAA